MSARDDLFGDLPDYLVEGALEACDEIELAANEIVMSAGEDDPAMAYILEGRVSIRRDGVEIDTSGPGEVVGESAVFRGGGRVADVVALTPVRALIVTEGAYHHLVGANNPLSFKLERMILTQLGARLARLDTLIGNKSEGEKNTYLRPPKGLLTQIREALTRKVQQTPVVDKVFKAADVLDNSHLFRNERYTLIEGLAQFTEHFVWTVGQTICEQGEEGDAVYIIAEGNADVFVHAGGGKIHKLGTVGRGACVGMTSLIEGRPRMATVMATEQVDALELKKASFEGLIAQDGQVQSAMRRAMIRAFAEQIDEAGANLVKLAGDVPSEVEAHVTTEIYVG